MTRLLWDAVAALGISALGVWVVLRYARQMGLLDIPNHRSSHTIPTPRGGGIALVIAVVAVGAYELVRSGPRLNYPFGVLFAAITALTLIGLMDDLRSIRVPLRLAVHIGCGVAVSVLVNALAPVAPGFNLLWLVWWAIWTVASVNIVNFMDGIDGIVAAQGVVYGVFLVLLARDMTFPAQFGIVLAAACLGFLIWNWPPARIFMGDVGSGPLGLFFVIGGALALRGNPAALVFLPLYPLFLDALLTLVIRLRKGEKLTDAHRSHLYQRLVAGGMSHSAVTLIYAFAAIVGALVAFVGRGASTTGMALLIAAYTLSVLFAWKQLHERARSL